MTLNPTPRKTDPMNPILPALRALLFAIVALGLLWSANAHALPASANHHRGSESRNHVKVKARADSITLSARSNHFDFSSLFSERGDACDKSMRGCLRSGRLEAGGETHKAPKSANTKMAKRDRRHSRKPLLRREELEIVRIHLGRHGRIEFHSIREFEPITIRPDQQPTHPIPEPHAALVFAFGIGIAAVRLRR
jgi:hypothetical protein